MRTRALYLALPILILQLQQPAEAVDIFGLKIFEKKKTSWTTSSLKTTSAMR
jgi:hypothetical protein